MVSGRHRFGLALVAATVLVTPSAADEAISRAATVRNVPDVPPPAISEAVSRALTVYALSDAPPPPITAAVSRTLTVANWPDPPPTPIQEAYSRSLTLRALPAPVSDPLTGATSRPLTVRNLPDLPPAPVMIAVSRALTVRNQPDVPPAPITMAISRALTVRVDPQTAAPPEVPRAFALNEARPNPFNPRTTIWFEVPRDARVSICVYNLRGALVTRLVDGGVVTAGRHHVDWDGRDLRGQSVASGIYYCRMTTEGYSKSIPLTLVK